MALVCKTCNMRLAEDANSLKPQDILQEKGQHTGNCKDRSSMLKKKEKEAKKRLINTKGIKKRSSLN